MAKRKTAPDLLQMKPTINLNGNMVNKDTEIDDEVVLEVRGKVSSISRDEYNENRLSQRIIIESVSKVEDGD